MKVFISSTYLDLMDYRRLASEAVERLGQQGVRMEVFGARPAEPTTASLSEVIDSDLFIGIYAHRYGFVPEGSSRSITEEEYDAATAESKPIFCFLVAEDYPWRPSFIEEEPGKSKLKAFKSRVKSSFIVESFTTPEDLAFKIGTSLGRHLANSGPVTGKTNPFLAGLASAGNLEAMLEVALRYLETATKTDYNQIFLAAAADYGSRLVAVANSITPGKQEYRVASFGGLLGNSFLNGKIINAANVKNWQNYFDAVGETKSELVVPIVRESLALGLLNAESEVENHFDEEMVHRVKLLADALAEALVQYGWNPALRQAGLPWVRRFPTEDGMTKGVAGSAQPEASSGRLTPRA